MRISVDEALKYVRDLRKLTDPTIEWLETQRGTEFDMETVRSDDRIAGGSWFVPGCLVPPLPADFARLAALAVVWGKYVGL